MDRLLSKKKYSKQNYLYGNKNSDRHCGVSWEKEVYNIKKKLSWTGVHKNIYKSQNMNWP